MILVLISKDSSSKRDESCNNGNIMGSIFADSLSKGALTILDISRSWRKFYF